MNVIEGERDGLVALKRLSKLTQRIILIIVTFPLIYILLFHLPQAGFLAMNLTITVFTFIAALEVRNLIQRQEIPTSRILAPALGASMPAFFYLVGRGYLDTVLIPAWLALALLAVLIKATLVEKKERLRGVLARASSSALVVIYPGFFLAFIVLMTAWDRPSLKILFFLSMIFTNDTSAYVAGTLFGRKSNFIISPNKSVAGFAAGFLGSVAMAAVFYFILPDLFSAPLPLVLLLGVTVGLTVILGDLIESAFKRSAEVKDSGTIMVGRGGVLDTVDSILASAPVFYPVSYTHLRAHET